MCVRYQRGAEQDPDAGNSRVAGSRTHAAASRSLREEEEQEESNEIKSNLLKPEGADGH